MKKLRLFEIIKKRYETQSSGLLFGELYEKIGHYAPIFLTKSKLS